MAVEHKDDNQPIANKLKENVESHDTDNKENLQENGNNADNNNNNNNQENTTNDNTSNNNNTTTDSNNNNSDDDDTNDNTEETLLKESAEVEAGIAGLAIAEPSNFTVKHPLQNSWTIWYDNPGKRSNQASWGDHLKKITTFSFVEDFWRVFNNLKPASALAQGSNYHIFKDYIEPKWEDPANSKGGKWTVSIPPKSRNSSLDQMWLWTVLAVIGETFDSPDDVCGLVVSVRKAGDRVQIWTKDANNKQACEDIGRSLKKNLELPDNILIGYQSHADSMKKTSKNRYDV